MVSEPCLENVPKITFTDEEINEIQSTYRSSCIKCCRKAEVEMRKLLKTEPNLNKSECKSCNNVYKNDFFFINKDKSVFDECSVCYIKNNDLPNSKQCIDCLKILPLTDFIYLNNKLSLNDAG